MVENRPSEDCSDHHQGSVDPDEVILRLHHAHSSSDHRQFILYQGSSIQKATSQQLPSANSKGFPPIVPSYSRHFSSPLGSASSAATKHIKNVPEETMSSPNQPVAPERSIFAVDPLDDFATIVGDWIYANGRGKSNLEVCSSF